MIGMSKAIVASTMRCKWHVLVDQQRNAWIIGFNTRNDHTVSRARIENISDWGQRIPAVGMGRQNKMIGCSRQGFADAEHHLAGKAHDLFVDGKHQCDDICLARAEANACTVWLISKLAGDKANTFLGIGADIGGVFQCP